MNELATTTKQPPVFNNSEAAALQALVADLNSGVVEEEPAAVTPPPAPAPVIAAALSRTQPPLANPLPHRLYFSGRLGAGKDFVAKSIGGRLFGFADPLYAVASYFFGIEVSGEKNKDLPGMRRFLQQVGQIGRGVVDENYPLSIERATFISLVRALGEQGMLPSSMEWKNFGHDNLIWVNAMLVRVNNAKDTNDRILNTNVRFEHELAALNAADFQGWHVMCSAPTLAARQLKRGLKPGAPELKDVSELFAMSMDANAIKQISQLRNGPKLRVIWNDERVASPSPRFYTLAEFVARK